jgi:acetyl esterase/lipase
MPRNIESSAGSPQPEVDATGTGEPDGTDRVRARIDHAYDNSAAFPDVPEWRLTWRQRSDAVPLVAPAKLDLAYGSGSMQKLDVFPHADACVPTAVFIHGGFWSRNSKETFRFVVRGIHAAGFHAVLIGHTLAPTARMDAIVEEARRATRWVFAHLDELGLAARPMIVLGWSSGAHLAAMVMGEPHIAAGLGISGVYDLEPFVDAGMNDVLRLDRDEALRNSANLNLPARSGRFAVAYGERELPAFRNQSERFHAARAARGLAGEIVVMPGHHHHSILDEIWNVEGNLTRIMASMAADI